MPLSDPRGKTAGTGASADRMAPQGQMVFRGKWSPGRSRRRGVTGRRSSNAAQFPPRQRFLRAYRNAAAAIRGVLERAFGRQAEAASFQIHLEFGGRQRLRIQIALRFLAALLV